MRMAFLTSSIGLCAIPFCAWAGVSLYEGGAAEQIVTPSAVERTNKTDRMVGVLRLRGEFLPAISVEVAGKSGAAVTVRDREGRMLYRLDPAEHMTIVAKRMMQTPAVPGQSGHGVAPREPASSDATRELPDGCEGAFSPYVEPGMANVIGRCVSEVRGSVQIASR
jgi:hypothetical protein